MKEVIEKQNEQIEELRYRRENDWMNLQNLKQLVGEYEKTEASLRQELAELKEEYHYL